MTTFGQANTFGKKAPSRGTFRRWKPTAAEETRAINDEAGDDLSPEALAFLKKEREASAGGAGIDIHQNYSSGSGVAGEPVGFIRIVSFLIDGVILSLPLFIMIPFFIAQVNGMSGGDPTFFETTAGGQALTGLMINYALLYMVIHFAYFIGMEASALQGTVGKKVLGLVVTDGHGNRAGLGAIVLRNIIGKTLSNLVPFYIGYIMAFFTEDKKALHDYVAGTTVRRRR
jgi:uncharacterized RDD family membrane protein YckC